MQGIYFLVIYYTMLKCICITWIFNKNEQVLALFPRLSPKQTVSTLPPNMEWKTKKLKKNTGTLMVVNGVDVSLGVSQGC